MKNMRLLVVLFLFFSTAVLASDVEDARPTIKVESKTAAPFVMTEDKRLLLILG